MLAETTPIAGLTGMPAGIIDLPSLLRVRELVRAAQPEYVLTEQRLEELLELFRKRPQALRPLGDTAPHIERAVTSRVAPFGADCDTNS